MAKTTSAQVFSRRYEYDDGTVVLAIDRNDISESVDSDVAVLEDEVYNGNVVDFGVYLTVYRRGQKNPSEFIFDLSGINTDELEHADTITNNGIVSVWFKPKPTEDHEEASEETEENEEVSNENSDEKDDASDAGSEEVEDDEDSEE